MNERPILSICIPTYNRAEYLQRVLKGICDQVSSTKVEVVISDNCSTDTTAWVVEEFRRKYSGPVIYNRNERNVYDGNFKIALSLATGEYLKLHNDTATLQQGAIDRMLRLIDEAKTEGRLPYFTDGLCSTKRCMVDNVDEFIQKTSYCNTWIAAFGIWREMRERVFKVMASSVDSKLTQSYALLDCVKTGTKLLVCGDKLWKVMPVQKKGGYNVAEVFGNNYIKLLKEYVATGDLSIRTYRRELRSLCKFINHYYFDLKHEFAFEKTGYMKWMLPFYWSKPYFYRRYAKMFVKNLLRAIC